MRRAVRELNELKDGKKARLSDAAISQQKIAQMHRRLEDVRVFLEKKAA